MRARESLSGFFCSPWVMPWKVNPEGLSLQGIRIAGIMSYKMPPEATRSTESDFNSFQVIMYHGNNKRGIYKQTCIT